MIATTIEQSKKLMELGIDLNTADMCYPYDRHLGKLYGDIPYVMGYKSFNKDVDFPSWSLLALLSLMPSTIIINGITLYIAIFKGYNDDYWYIQYNDAKDNVFKEICELNPLDAAFETICWLLENKKI